MIRDGLRVAADDVGAEIECSGHLRRGGEREIGVTVGEVHIAREDGLSVLDDVNISGSALLSREDLQVDAVAGAIDGAVGAQQDLILAGARFERDSGGRAAAAVVVGVNRKGLAIPICFEEQHGDAAAVAGEVLCAASRYVHHELCGGGCAVGIGGEQVDLVVEPRHELAALRHGGDEQR